MKSFWSSNGVRTEDGKLFFCVYLLKETRFIRCRYFSSFSRLASGTVPVRGREREILRRIVKFRRGAPGYVVRVKFIGQAVFAVGIEMHPARRGLFLADAAAAVRGIGGNDKKTARHSVQRGTDPVRDIKFRCEHR